MKKIKNKPDKNFQDRSFIRVKTVFPVEFCFVEKLSKNIVSTVFQAFTNDISKGGIALSIQSPTPELYRYLEIENEDFLVSLKITPPFLRKPILAFAKSAWYKDNKTDDTQPILLGLEYTEVLEKDRKRLYRYVNALRRKPFEIGLLVTILLSFIVYLFFNGKYSFFQKTVLQKNMTECKSSIEQLQQDLMKEKKQKKIVQLQLENAIKKTEKWKKTVNTVSKNLTNHKTEARIKQLEHTNLSLRERINLLSEECSQMRKKILTFLNKSYGFVIQGTDFCYKVEENKAIDIISLHSGKILSGTVTESSDNIITLKPEQNKMETISFLPKDIANLMTIEFVDYDQHTNKKDTHSLSSFSSLTDRDIRIELLKKIQYDSFKYFLNERNKQTGLVKENSETDFGANISSTAFAILAYCIAHEKGWLLSKEAYKMVLTILETFQNKLENKNGFFYRFVHIKTGKRYWNSEISSLETSFFIACALTAGECFPNSEITTIAQQLYDRINWTWMTNKKSSLAMSWKPKIGFLPYYWYTYNEGILAYILAIGSSTHPIPKNYWHQIKKPTAQYKDYHIVYSETGSLLVYQYPHIFVDFKNINDNGFNHWENTKKAILANRQFCIDQKENFPLSYGEHLWGITASDGPRGFQGYGAKPGVSFHDGTISPSAIIASLPFVPKIAWSSIKFLYQNHSQHIYGFYGFRDAFNIELSWFSDKYIGINQGLSVVMIENYLSGFVSKYFMKTNAFQKWASLCISKNKETKSLNQDT